MEMDSTGSSGRATPLPPVSTAPISGEHQQRNVSQNPSDTAVAGHQHPADYHFKPLNRRDVTLKEVSLGKTIDILTRFATQRITKWFTAATNAQLKDLKRHANGLAKDYKHDLQKREKLQKEVREIDQKLEKLRPKISEEKR